MLGWGLLSIGNMAIFSSKPAISHHIFSAMEDMNEGDPGPIDGSYAEVMLICLTNPITLLFDMDSF